MSDISQISARRLLPLDRLEQGLEVPLTEALGTLALNDLVEQRGAVLHRLAEDLEQVAFIVAVHQDAELLELSQLLVNPADPLLHCVVVRLGHLEEIDPAIPESRNRLNDIVRRDRDV